MSRKRKERDLMVELIDLLREFHKRSPMQMEHKVESGEHFEKRTFETTALAKDKNMHIKVLVHSWWGR